MMKGVFITGTSTDVGKTVIAVSLLQQLQKLRVVIPRKPVESGCKRTGNELIPADALALQRANDNQSPLSEICPYRFEPAISPQRAALLANKTITIKQLQTACTIDHPDAFVLVEGAGGFYSPLCSDGLNADLAQALQLPVLLVSDNALGCINHVLLSVEAIRSRKLGLCAVIINETGEQVPEQMNNVEDIEKLIDAPVFFNSFNSKTNRHLPERLITLFL